ncbi:phenylalanyl-tRNA synthetase alpha chain [Lentilactobacillus kosonis]|uniref:Phenylalanyl-tRNA synthetase alpha chain n=1 Tax=Lentilactobacillus kosonis TaxID=2810561 RepID=A0A401FKF8_9LACO|nr:phenylalanyl-tRNA synthetase alpha chain [Lentilactobacillus kosonis]
MSLREDLTNIRTKNLEIIQTTDNLKVLNDIRVNLLGKKGPITTALRSIKDLPVEERPEVGSYANEIRDDLANAIAEQKTNLENAQMNARLASESIDVTLPGTKLSQGQPHVIQQIIDQIVDLF